MIHQRSVTHASFAIERTYPASPALVFRAFAEPALKARWFGAAADPSTTYELDFRVGGRERARGSHDGSSYEYDACIEDIVPDQRIVTTYSMFLGDRRISVSVASVELNAHETGTRLLYTEQAAFLDDLDTVAQREQGTRELLDALAAVLERDSA